MPSSAVPSNDNRTDYTKRICMYDMYIVYLRVVPTVECLICVLLYSNIYISVCVLLQFAIICHYQANHAHLIVHSL